MISPEQTLTVGPTARRYPSLKALREEHTGLLRRRSFSEGRPEFLADVERFLELAQATGEVLESYDDRGAVQSLLDYWTNILQRAGREARDLTLAPFDPAQLDVHEARELGDELYPYQQDSLLVVRQGLIDQCVDRLRERRLLVVAGPAGSGRSTLVRVGLVPILQAGGLPGSDGFKCVIITPESNPSATLDRLREATGPTAREPAICVIDHFENVLVRWDEHERQTIVDHLTGLAEKPDTGHIVILIMRSDYLAYAAKVKAFEPWFDRIVVRVKPFDAREVREVIEKPATAIGLKFEDGLIEQLVEDVLGDPAALALLHFTLQKLWEKRKRDWITWDAYVEVGGAQTLERSLEDFYQRLSAGEQAIVKRILLRLVRPGLGREITTQSIPQPQLYEPGDAHDQVDDLLKGLMFSGFVRLVKDETASDLQVAVTHEALAFHWPRLLDWLSEERDAQRRRLRLTDAAKAWRDRGKDPGALWRGLLLDEAQDYRDMDDLEREFVEASAMAEKKRTTRRIQLYGAATLATIAIAGLIVAVLVVDNMNAKRERRLTEAQQRLTESHNDELEEANDFLQWAYDDARQQSAEVRRRMKQLVTERGFRLLERGDLSGSLLWSIEAWKSESDSDALQTLHRIRTAAGMNQMPRLARQWSHETLFASHTEFSPDGRYLATARGSTDGNHGQVQVWDSRTDVTKTLAIDPEAGAVNRVAFSSDGRYLAAASGKRGGTTGQIEIWETATGEPTERRLPLPGAATAVEFDRSGERIVCACQAEQGKQGQALIWDWQTAATARTIFENTSGLVNHAAFSRDGRRVVVTTENQDANSGLAYVIDAQSGTQVAVSPSHQAGVNYAAFSPDDRGRYVVTASGDQSAETGEALVWDTSNAAARPLRLHHDGGVIHAAFSPDGKTVVTTSHDASARVWDAANGKQRQMFSHDSSVNRATFSPDGRFLATASRDRTACVWDITTGDPVTPLLYHLGTVSSATFNTNGRWLATSSRNTAQVWNLDTGSPSPAILKSDGSVDRVACSSDGRRVMTVSHSAYEKRDIASVWDLASGELRSTLETEPKVGVVALSADGDLAAATSTAKSTDHTTITIHDVPGDSHLATAEIDGVVTLVAFSRNPADRMLLAVSKATGPQAGETHFTVHVYDALTGELVARVDQDEAIQYASFSHDSSRVVIAGGDIRAKTGTARVVEARTGRPVSTFSRHAGGVIQASFSSDDRLVVTAGADDGAWIWDANSGEAMIREPLRHTADVTRASFSRDDALVLTVSYDKKTKVWDAATGEGVANIDHGVEAVLSPDGRHVVTVARDGVAKVWDVYANSLIAVLKDVGDIQTAQFSNDGGTIYTVSYNVPWTRGDRRAGAPVRSDQKRLVRTQVWNVAPEGRALKDLTAYAHLVSSRTIDSEKVEPTAIDADTLAAYRGELKESFFKDFLAEPPREFYLREAANCEATEQWFAAAWHLKRALDAGPRDPDLHARLGWALSQSGRPIAAIESYSQAVELELDPKPRHRWSDRGWAYLNARQWTKAVADFDEALLREPNNSTVLSQRAQAFSELGDWANAAKDLARVVEIQPDNHEAWYHLGVAYLAQKDTAAYRRVCTEMLQQVPEELSPEAANDLAWACVLAPDAVPDPKRVVELATGADNRVPQNYYFLNTLGAALYRAGDYDAAIRILRDSMRAHTGQFLGQAAASSPAQQADPARPIFDEQGTAYDWFFMAMAEHRLDHKEAARNWMARSVQWMEQLTREVPDPQDSAAPPLAAINRQELTVLRADAESVLKEDEPPQ